MLARCHREAAFPASNHSRECEVMGFGMRRTLAPKEALHAFELVQRDHRRMLSRIGSTVPFNHSGIERARKDPIDTTHRDGFVSNSFVLFRAEPPLVGRNV